MPHGDVETYHQEGKWRNRIEGGAEIPGEYDHKDHAVKAGRDVAKAHEVEHIIRNLDGEIHERSTYGRDPRDIPG